ncbi:hypothetical protein DT73_11870 [Mangrovibacter sp. MFB070]|uniref:hypothetical protein n=1 Tax=Mangrovibacter sp. MFB070 TaxID=1224318 RepID=UPI0004DA4153|nr:hypothetical protein [Mangrovibacter sp. MFB070]KEA52782.1 hypothetical protein DT73_11870 [Mangrovibacter sp. MFB070]
MDAVVVLHEHRIGFIVLRDEDGGFIVAELQSSDDIQRGDIISGVFDVSQTQTFKNKANEDEVDLLVHGTGMTEEDAIKFIQTKTAS